MPEVAFLGHSVSDEGIKGGSGEDISSDSMDYTDERQGGTYLPWPSRLLQTFCEGIFLGCSSTNEVAENTTRLVRLISVRRVLKS